MAIQEFINDIGESGVTEITTELLDNLSLVKLKVNFVGVLKWLVTKKI